MPKFGSCRKPPHSRCRSRVLAPHTLSVATCGELWLANLQEPPGVELRFEGNAYSHGHRSCDRARSTRRRPARRCCRWSVRLGSVQGRTRGQGVAGAARYPAPDKARTLARSLRGVHSADCTQQPLSDLVGAPRARVTGFALPVLVEGLLSPFRQNATAADSRRADRAAFEDRVVWRAAGAPVDWAER